MERVVEVDGAVLPERQVAGDDGAVDVGLLDVGVAGAAPTRRGVDDTVEVDPGAATAGDGRVEIVGTEDLKLTRILAGDVDARLLADVEVHLAFAESRRRDGDVLLTPDEETDTTVAEHGEVAAGRAVFLDANPVLNGESDVLVVLALVLNSVVYTGTLATADGNAEDAREVDTFRETVPDEVRVLLDHANREHDASHAALYENFSADVERLAALTSRQYATESAAANATLLAVTNETRLGQTATRNFTDDSHTVDWTVASSVPAVRRFEMAVTQDSLRTIENGSCATSECFTVVVANDTADWRLTLNTSDAGDITATVVTPSGATETCSVTADRAWVNLTDGTLGGQACPALNVTATLTAPYDVRFRDAGLVEGQYTLLVEGVVPASPHFDDSGDPFAEPGIRAATVGLTYRTGDVGFESQTRIRGGGTDA